METHISWVLLTGEFAYKIKKPVDFGFLDFSTLALRRRFCEEEVRLNRRFAKSLYVDVVPITMTDGAASFRGNGEAIEYAVRMRQFPSEMQLDRLLDAGKLPTGELGAFGSTLAAVHATLPRVTAGAKFGTAAAVLAPVAENFLQVRQSLFSSLRREQVDELQAWSNARHAELAPTIEQRRHDGYVRECHGDMHLSNLVRLDDGIHAFDCIEFSEALRWIDVISDAAFLMMDCEVRNRSDLAYAFLDGYLEHSGDYRGVALLGFYLVYRSMVRAKVAALQAKRADDADLLRRFHAHIDFARERALLRRSVFVLMCGVSGSGKSWVAERLVQRLPGVRIRSDIERKRLANLAPQARTQSGIDSGLYAADRSDALYDHLLGCAEALAVGGERVIVDATFLSAARRTPFIEAAARSGIACVIVYCRATRDVLAQRIERRNAERRDPSEATVEVLDAQLASYEAPTESEAIVVTLDTSGAVDVAALADRISRSFKP
ncbi:MAG TPA: AAA family ATPase [Pseudomonadales bacterium]|nr:AAA family ATPase [Pseudomonadales bacterium]